MEVEILLVSEVDFRSILATAEEEENDKPVATKLFTL
jgi:hypothetical protein